MNSKDCPIRWIHLKVASVDRSLLKGEAPRVFADLEIDMMIAMSGTNFHSVDRDMDIDMYMDAGTKDTDPWTSEMDIDIDTDMGLALGILYFS